MHRAAALATSYKTASRLFRSLENGRFGVLVLSRQPTSTTPASSAAVAARVAQEPFLNGSSSVYVEEMYNAWTKDPNSVHKSWDAFFRNASADAEPGLAHQRPPTLFPSGSSFPAVSRSSGVGTVDSHRDIDDHLSVQAIIRSYQVCFRCSLYHFYHVYFF